jgi:phosphopantothenoylcysteine decarboxylase/phosphopantothenate--cysteine ligase
MNNRMFEHPATQANLALLRERGVEVIEPGVGRLATIGEYGVGRLPEPVELLAACEARLARGASWRGRRVLVSAGGTREAIDSVRYIGNRSSGRMGFAVARAAAERGAEVVVVAANVALARERGIRYLDVVSAAELAEACAAEMAEADVLVMCAAVGDFRPLEQRNGKLARQDEQRVTLELEATSDILAALAAARRDGQLLVGFAAEHGAGGLERAREKLARKQVDLIVYNDISEPGIGFDAIENEVTLLGATGERQLPRAAKVDIARGLLDAIDELAR